MFNYTNKYKGYIEKYINSDVTFFGKNHEMAYPHLFCPHFAGSESLRFRHRTEMGAVLPSFFSFILPDNNPFAVFIGPRAVY